MPQDINLENQKWSVGKKLAEGGFANVYVAHPDDGPPAVVKLIPKSPGAGENSCLKKILTAFQTSCRSLIVVNCLTIGLS